ncbi:hypothetical protein MRS76_04740 [Rhizobiaceae bacterium n13]|uniref:Uncharacterized protein n=1 Tax=Ferirhizobium litorale TaxID=2927786 RepID=A0AAE3U0I6_9HYPH|nr:hypothetical protein [Fererhizobium litorale]MDI7861254.1 hypothetical protein [Fererhizobium litorale]MDI7921401.1 hypothetical protein [Fererhizobium litorale]
MTEAEDMQDSKTCYRSRSVWGAIVAILAAILQLAGGEFGAAERQEMVDAAVTIAGAIGGVLALYGRLEATARIAPAGTNRNDPERLRTGN